MTCAKIPALSNLSLIDKLSYINLIKALTYDLFQV